jgi:hypothetical protein
MAANRAHAFRFRFCFTLPIAALLVLGTGCDKKAQEPAAQQASPLLPLEPQSAPKTAPAMPPAAGSAQQEPLHITWVDPPAFKRVPPSNPMRKASYVVPHATGDGEDGELAVFYFGPGQGGGIDANVERWVKQFADVKPSDVKRADRDANGLRQHTVELESGTFSSGMAMGGGGKPKSNYGLLGGIVEAPSGAYFFKLTGPSKTVKQAKAEFYKLLDSIKAE